MKYLVTFSHSADSVPHADSHLISEHVPGNTEVGSVISIIRRSAGAHAVCGRGLPNLSL